MVPFVPTKGPYIHVYQYEGYEQHVPYSVTDFEEIPQKPETSFELAAPGSELLARWEQYHLYEAVVLHEYERHQEREEHLRNQARYILNNCISEADRKRIVSAEDYRRIYAAAICPEVTEEDIADVLASTFQGYMEGEVFVGISEHFKVFGRLLAANTVLGVGVDAEVESEPAGVRPYSTEKARVDDMYQSD